MESTLSRPVWRTVFLFLLFLAIFLAAYFVFVFLGGVLGVFSPFPKPQEITVSSPASREELPLFLIDPGHGGEDGGACADDGTMEKNINLALSWKIGDFLEASGARVIYTRTEDVMLSHPGSSTKKSGDVMGRVAVAKEHPEAIFVSIHMNKFPQKQYSGLQVFFSPNHEKSLLFAEQIQSQVILQLQPTNNRLAKKAGSEIFILDRIKNPAILVECGFLSNEDELKQLKNDAYLQALAFVISHSLLQTQAQQ